MLLLDEATSALDAESEQQATTSSMTKAMYFLGVLPTQSAGKVGMFTYQKGENTGFDRQKNCELRKMVDVMRRNCGLTKMWI